ncbi:hypothetical protein BGZ83_010828 [Gryganskiella cystojenkinii]|nr:hypothetical protein BGZ83_010828 [Gryganskiella cystojenkinii]
MSQDMDDFNGTCYKSGPNTLLAVPTPVNHSSYMPPIMTLQQQLHQQQQRLLPPDLGSNGVDEDPAIRRAEQNRAAQRAFRQRKQQYIKWLESKAEELDEVYRIMALVRTENQQLCKLVIELNDQLQIATGSGRKYLDGSPTTTATSISSTPAKDKKITGTPPPSRTSPARAAAAVAAVASTGGLNGHGILDLSISREVSLRLMNLTMTPGTSLSGDRENGAVTRPKYQPRSSSISSGDVKGTHTKGKSAFKQSMQLKRQEQNHLSLLQNQHVMLQQQLQQQQHHQHHLQQQQHQNFGAITATTTAVPSTVAGNGNSNNSSGVIGNNTSPLFFNKCLTSSPTSTTLTPGSFVGPGDPQFPIAASSTVIGASAESPLRAALSAAVGLQQQQQQLIAQQRYPYSHPSLLALQPEQMMPQQPPSSMFEANIPATLTGLVINTNSYVQGRSTIPSPRHNHLHHPYATAGYPLPGAQHQRVQSKPEQQQPLPSHQLTPQPIYFHPQSTLYQQQTPPALAHGMSGGGNGGGASHSVPPLHSKVAQTMWMDEEMTSPGKGRRSSMPILHLGSTPHHHQQQQKQSHHSLQQ